MSIVFRAIEVDDVEGFRLFFTEDYQWDTEDIGVKLSMLELACLHGSSRIVKALFVEYKVTPTYRIFQFIGNSIIGTDQGRREIIALSLQHGAKYTRLNERIKKYVWLVEVMLILVRHKTIPKDIWRALKTYLY